MFNWEQGYLNHRGELVDDCGNRLLGEDVKFESVHEAAQYCVDNDYRITVVGEKSIFPF